MSKKLIFLICFVLALGLVSAAGAADPSLLGWYRFEGNTDDSSDYANHGTAQGGPLWISGPPGYAGAIRFDGADDYVGTGNTLLANVSQFTMAGWVAAGNPTASRIGLFGQNDVIEMGFNAGNISIWTSAAGTTQTLWPFPNLTWHHLAIVADTSMKIYLDGLLAVTGAGAANYGTSTYPFNIGGGGIWDATGNWFSGSMDEVRVYNRALTQAEVQALAIRHEATNPSPADGAAVPPLVSGANVYMVLDYTPSAGAITHTGYFSDVKADVEARDPAHSLGSPPWPEMSVTAYYVGYDDPAMPFVARPPLVPGKTYYWAIDEFDGTTTCSGYVWSFTVMPEEAWGPTPMDGDTSVLQDPNVLLSWRLGNVPTDYTIKYPLYYSTSKAAVDTGTTPNVTVSTTSKSVGGLPSNTTIYWRVDTKLNSKVPPFPLFKTIKGKTWSFKTLPVVAITDPNLVAWYKLDGEFPSLVFDYSGYANHGTLRGDPQVVPGHDANALHFDGIDDFVEIPHRNILSVNNEVTVMAWINAERLSGPGGAEWQGILAKGESPRSYSFYTTTSGVLHFSTAGVGSTSTLTVTTNEWTHVAAMVVGGVHRYYINGTFAGEGGTGVVLPGTADSAPVRIAATQEASRQFLGLIDDVRIYDTALSAKEIKVLAGRLGATDPDPADGATDVQRTPTLTWEAGAYAASVNGHKVYFSAERDAVMNRTVTAIIRTDPCYPIATILDLGKTYYWAVDEVNGLDVWPGDLWSFTTVNYLVVDDMEKYQPNVPSPSIYQVWVDGAGDCASIPGNNSGALVDISTLAALTPVHGDQQAMKLLYDNDGTVNNPCPPGVPTARLTYSKAEALVAKLPSGIGSDWTAGGVTKALSLWFYGDPLNSIEPMWVQLTDASNNKAKVLYGKYADENVKDVNEASWHEWLIDLADFTGVNVANVKSIAIGIGNETGPAGGSGTLYFDDIRLYTPRCVLTRRSADFAPFDYVGDCRVDYRELERMADQWLLGKEAEVAWAPFGTWSHADIGSTATAGGLMDNGDGSYSVTGSGADIWGTADAFHYVYKPLVGDGQMTVNVVNITGTSANIWQKAGVMIRETLAAGSRNVMMLMSKGPGAASTFAGGDAFQWRPVTDQASSSSHVVCDNIEVLMPNCVRLVRTGNMFSGFVYVNGEWVQEGQTVTIAMPQTVYIGLAVTSHDNAAGIYTTATFNSVCDSSFGGLLPDLTGGDDLVNFVDYAALMDRFLDEDFFP